MTDPLSITASAVGLCALAVKIVQYLDGIHDAPEDIKAFRQELANTSLALRLLSDHTKALAWFSIPFPSFEALTGKDGPLDRFGNILNLLMMKLGLGETAPKRTTRLLTWPFRKTEINELLECLERYKTLFLLAMGHDQSFVSTILTTVTLSRQTNPCIGDCLCYSTRSKTNVTMFCWTRYQN